MGRMRIEPRQVRNLLVTGAVICALLGANVLTAPAFDLGSGWPVAIMLGVCIGQLTLIATWAALGSGNVMVRLPWSLLLTASMWLALVVGLRIEWHSYFDRSSAFGLGLLILFGLFVAMTPLVIAAHFFGWRLLGWKQQDATDTRPVSEVQFHLKHLLLSMFLLSLAMAMVRWGLPEGRPWSSELDGESIVFLTTLAFCNLFVTTPCIWGAFASARRIPLLAVGWFAYCAVLTAVEIGVFTFFWKPLREVWLDIFFLFYLMNLMQCLTVFGVLLIFRAIGFRLVRVNSRRTQDPPPSL
jgi:hypothetical protein